MNSTPIKLNLKTFLALPLVVILTSGASFAKMAARAPQKAVPITETIHFYTKKKSTTQLSPNEANILKLSLLAQDAFGIKEFSIPVALSTEKERVEAVTDRSIVNLIEQVVQQKSNWDEPISKSNLEKLKQNSELIKNTFNESSYAWAWVSYQNGLKKEAKNILAVKFEKNYTEVMQLKEIYAHQSSPLSEGENLIKVLNPMSTETEKKSREEQLKKMRTHISGLPDLQIMT